MFGKIFASMFEGSLPSSGWEAVVTLQQMIVLANKHGEIDMTAEAISRRTTIPVDIILKGIEALEAPDPYSRTPGEEGRRIVRLDESRPWGWRIVNYTKYRDIQSAEDRREYFRLQKQKQRAGSAQEGVQMSTMSTDVHRCPPDSTKAEAEAVKTLAHSSSVLPDGFQTFWEAYPRKCNKARAVRAFRRKVKYEELPKIMACLEAQKRTEQWRKDGGSFIPHPSTWLNDERWKDEIQANHEPPAPRRRNELTEEGRAIYAKFGVSV